MIENFLIEAKRQTYANESAPKIKNSRLNSKDYEYKKDNMIIMILILVGQILLEKKLFI